MRRGRIAKRHDCGEHGQLTVREIAPIAGLSEPAIYSRLSRGVSGAALCAPAMSSVPQPGRTYTDRTARTNGNITLAVACIMARKFPDRPPSVDQLRAEFDMSRATAYRWRAAFRDAMGLER